MNKSGVFYVWFSVLTLCWIGTSSMSAPLAAQPTKGSYLIQSQSVPHPAQEPVEAAQQVYTSGFQSNRTSPQRELTVEIPVIPQADNTYVVPTLLNQKVVGSFLVDTGASYTVITPETAKLLGLKVDQANQSIPITTANGILQAPIVHLNHVALGGIQLDNVDAVVAELGSNTEISGLLGMSFFRGMELSFKHDKLIISR